MECEGWEDMRVFFCPPSDEVGELGGCAGGFSNCVTL